MESTSLPLLTVSELSKLIASRQVSPVEVVDAVLERIGALNKQINAFITVTADQARRAAQQAEKEILAGSYRGPLHGVPISLKDLFWTKGVRTTAGSRVMSDFVPGENATVVERLEAAGAILVGKTNMHEFAFGVSNNNPHYGPTRNPWDLERVPGGSSGGSGAAVAASMCIAALGTDTGGSIRIPSAVCGIVGIKPTYGRVSRHGVVPLSWSLDHVGPMTKCVEDAAVTLKAIAGRDAKDASSSRVSVPDYAANLDGGIRGLRLGVHKDFFFSNLEPEIEQATLAALDTLQHLGAEVVEVSIPNLEHASHVTSVIIQAEASSYHGENMRSRPTDYGPDVRLRLEMGEFLPASRYVTAQRTRAKLIHEALEVFKGVDAILTPTTPVLPAKIDEVAPTTAGGREADVRRNLASLTSPFNALGFPVVSAPCGFTSEGLPIGLQIVGKPFAESTVLKIAYAYEQATSWHLRRPPIDV